MFKKETYQHPLSPESNQPEDILCFELGDVISHQKIGLLAAHTSNVDQMQQVCTRLPVSWGSSRNCEEHGSSGKCWK